MVDGKRRRGPVDLKSILEKVIRDNRFQGRVHEGKLAKLWDEIFDGEMGQLIRRDGSTLTIRVQGSAMKYEFEHFKKTEILESLHMHHEFSSIRNIVFTEK